MDRVNGRKAREPTLDQLLDELTDDLMRLSDAELLAELEADGVDAADEAKAARTAIAAGFARAGRAQLKAARAAVDRERKARVVGPPVRAERRVEVLMRFAQHDPKLRTRLTMAARGGSGITEAEANSILADLRELGAIDDNGDPK